MTVFYRKWRPQTLAEVVGQEPVTQTLANALATGRVAHAYLFAGPRGTGKTTTARILAKAVNCLNNGRGEPCNSCSICKEFTEGRSLDLMELDAASNRGIDEVRSLREKINLAPGIARYKVYIIDEVHMLTAPAFAALLKTLEEPPPHAIFILATTDPEEVPATIISRCQRFDFRRLSPQATVSCLERICRGEGLELEPASLRLISRSSEGSLRDAINLLEQLIAAYGPTPSFAQAKAFLGLKGDFPTAGLVKSLFQKDLRGALGLLNRVREEGGDLRLFVREVVDYLRAMLLVKNRVEGAVDWEKDALTEMAALADTVSLGEILRALRLMVPLEREMEDYNLLPLELAVAEFIGLAETPPAPLRKKEDSTKESGVKAVRVEPAEAKEPPSRIGRAAPSGNSLEALRTSWKEVVEKARKASTSVHLDALLRSSCQPVAVEGDTIVLGFYHNFHKEKIESPENMRIVEGLVSQVLGGSYKIRCVLSTREKKPSLAEEAIRLGARPVEERNV